MRFAEREVVVLNDLIPGEERAKSKVADLIDVDRAVKDVTEREVVVIPQFMVKANRVIINPCWLND